MVLQTDIRHIGGSTLEVSAVGVGTWQWGDTSIWQYGQSYGTQDVDDAFKASLEAGINFFDTAEVYGRGLSETLLGKAARKANSPVVIATKYAPLPMRLKPAEVEKALEASLNRLGLSSVDLYQVHWPYSLIQQEDLMVALSGAVKLGKAKAVGVSNYNAAQLERAANLLEKYGVKLASNQVQYSLLHRKPEKNGVLEACRRLNVSLIAYSPLAQGLLTGKYSGQGATEVSGLRRFMPNFRTKGLAKIEPLIKELKSIAAEREKTPAQVALNWLLSRDKLVLVIPGAKNAKQATQNAGALGWQLTEREFARLDKASAAI
ncbi:MAG: aldo/keto reductase [Chloroflexota bacterium]|nr:aldo/keto reductase [Chloroflexota bacterium]